MSYFCKLGDIFKDIFKPQTQLKKLTHFNEFQDIFMSRSDFSSHDDTYYIPLVGRPIRDLKQLVIGV